MASKPMTVREIRENHLHHDYPQEQCQRCFLLAHLDEVVKLAREYRDLIKYGAQRDLDAGYKRLDEKLDRCLAEHEKGE